MAIYNGKEFIKQKFSSTHKTPLIIEAIAEDYEIREELEALIPPAPIEDIDIWSPDYQGDPDDPANVTSPNALNSQGKPMFASIVTVGDKGQMFSTIPEAIAALVNDYGDDGGGDLFAIEIDPNYTPDRLIDLRGKKTLSDYSWISLFMKNNSTLNIDKSGFYLVNITKSPIFNFKMSCTRQRYYAHNSHIFNTGYAPRKDKDPHPILTFGKNTSITYNQKVSSTHPLVDGYSMIIGDTVIEARNGINVRTNISFTRRNCLINKGNFIFTGDYQGYLFRFHGCEKSNFPRNEIYNTTISSDLTHPKAGIFCVDAATAYLRNVTSTDRKGKTFAVRVCRSTTTLEDCNFSSQTGGTLHAGFDIVLDPTYADYAFSETVKTEIYLKNTTGNTSHILNKKIKNMVIYQE